MLITVARVERRQDELTAELLLLSNSVQGINRGPVFNPSLALELAYLAVEEALRQKATYADVRYEADWEDEVVVHGGRLALADSRLECGLAVRVLVGGAWGFSAVSEPNRHDVAVAVKRATELARAAAILQEKPVLLTEQEAQRGVFRTPIQRDPMSVSLEEKVHRLSSLDDILRASAKIVASKVIFHARRQRKMYVSSEGSELEQDLLCTGVLLHAVASDGEDYQSRSYSGGGGRYLSRGWESIEESGLEDRARETSQEAVELLSADDCPQGPSTLVLGGEQMATHVVRGLSPLLAMDRVVGLSDAGHTGTFLSPADLGRKRIASSSVSLLSDPTYPGGAGTYGFDDEGVPAERGELLSEGRVLGYLTGRESAALVGLERSQGTMRASSWSEPPTVRPSNLIMEPGSGGDLEALIADTENGIYLDGPLSFSTDGTGRTFVGASEIGWTIEKGRRTRPVRGPTYRGGTEAFWRACVDVADRSAWALFGMQLGKKEGERPVAVGVGAAPARFIDVEVGTRTPLLVRVSSSGPLPLAHVSPPLVRGSSRRGGSGVNRGRRRPLSDVK